MICIYQIRNLINGKVYVGQTVNESRRKANHLFLLRMNKHHSIKLQNAYNKYGEKNFIFEILEECSKEELNDRELYYIQKKTVIIMDTIVMRAANLEPIEVVKIIPCMA